MESESIVTISASVVGITQLVKWSGLPDKLGPGAVFVLSFIGVALYRTTVQEPVTILDAWPIFTAWVAVALGASGVYGFSRSDVAKDLTRFGKEK